MSNEENKAVVDESQATPEPTDIASAFKIFNENNRKAAESNVASGEATESEGDIEGTVSTEPDGTADDATDTVGDIPEDTSGSVGGSTTLIEPVDYSPHRQEVLKNIQNQAINEVRKELKDNGVDLWTITDIREQELDRDGNPTGRVFYRNPDDPNNPFTNRTDAQNFINSINDEINNLFRTKVNEKQQELLQKSLPTLRMMDFAPTYQKMSDIEKEVFDDLVSPYAIKNEANAVIGFNVDLEAVANTAKQISKRFSQSQNTQTQDSKQVKENTASGSLPAMDMKSGNGVSPDENEPKTIGEALKRVDEMNRKKKEGK